MSSFSLIVLIFIFYALFQLSKAENFTEDKDLLYLRRRQETRCNATVCVIKYFDASIEPFYFVSECKADKIKTVIFEEVTAVDEFPNLFEDVKHVSTIRMNGTSLSRFKAETFKHASHLEEIYLVNNSITELGSFTFDGATKVKLINLANNKITLINPKAFGKLTSLRELNLAQNLIETMDVTFFTDNERLHSLDLSGNRLTNLDQRIFYQCCPDLAWLYLQKNQLTNLTLKFKYNKLYWLNVDNNFIQELAVDADETDTNGFAYISANRNQITKIRISPKYNVRNLYLENNQQIDLFDLKSMSTLADLRLGNSNLTHVSSIVFNNFKNLELLYLQGTNFTTLRADLFASQRKLKLLHIGYNALGFADLRFLKSLKALEQLYLDGNELNDLNVADVKEILPNLKKVELRANRWSCRNLKTILGYLRAYEVELISREVEGSTNEPNVDGIRCYEDDANVKDLRCQISDLEARLSAMEAAYNENLKVMKESECCGLGEAKEMKLHKRSCGI